MTDKTFIFLPFQRFEDGITNRSRSLICAQNIKDFVMIIYLKLYREDTTMALEICFLNKRSVYFLTWIFNQKINIFMRSLISSCFSLQSKNLVKQTPPLQEI